MVSMAPPKQSPRTETLVTLDPKSSSGDSRMVMIFDVLLLPHPHVVGTPRIVAPDQHLIGAHHPVRIELGARHHLAFAVAADVEVAALAHVHRHPHDRIVLRLAMHFGPHRVGLAIGEKTPALAR